MRDINESGGCLITPIDKNSYFNGTRGAQNVSDTTWKKHILFKQYIKKMSEFWFQWDVPFNIIDMHAGSGYYDNDEMCMSTWLIHYIRNNYPDIKLHAVLCEKDEPSRNQLQEVIGHDKNVTILEDHNHINTNHPKMHGLILCDPQAVTEWDTFTSLVERFPRMCTFHHLQFVNEHRVWQEPYYKPLRKRFKDLNKKYLYVSEKFKDKVIVTTFPYTPYPLALKSGYFSQTGPKGYKIISSLECKHFPRKINVHMSVPAFIYKSKKIYGTQFDHSETIWDAEENIFRNIKCTNCGEMFDSKIACHLKFKKGCPICDKQYHTDTPLAFKRFEVRAKKKFGDKFTYIAKSFKGMRYKCKAICPKHGEIDIWPQAHLKSQTGCVKCGDEQANIKRLQTSFDNLVKKVIKKHGDRFDTNTFKDFAGALKPMTFTCPVHGEQTTPEARSLYTTELGCAKCNQVAGGKKRRKNK